MAARPQSTGVNASVGALHEPTTGHVLGEVAPGHVLRPGRVMSRNDREISWFSVRCD